MRVVKTRLKEMVPMMVVFLDIDDLEEGRGAEYVDASSVCLIFCSGGYFNSPNCMREMLRATLTHKPILAMLEPETIHGGLSIDEVRSQLRACELPCEKHGKTFASKFAMWGLQEEVKTWGYHMPTAETLFEALITIEPTEWNRAIAFQDVTLRLVAERILRVLPSEERELREHLLEDDPQRPSSGPEHAIEVFSEEALVYVCGEVANQRLSMPPPASAFHMFASDANPGAIELLAELAKSLEIELVNGATTAAQTDSERSSLEFSVWRKSQQYLGHQKDPVGQLHMTTSIDLLDDCGHMLVYLDDRTWTSGDTSDKFAAEVQQAMDMDIHLVLAHEMVGLGQDERFGCEFGKFFETTPSGLLQRGIYNEIARPLRGGPWRQASLVLLGIAIGGRVHANDEQKERAWLLHRAMNSAAATATAIAVASRRITTAVSRRIKKASTRRQARSMETSVVQQSQTSAAAVEMNTTD